MESPFNPPADTTASRDSNTLSQVETSTVATLIAEHEKIEALLRQQNQEHRIIFDSMPAMIWYKDAENRIIKANRLAAETIGYTVEELEGKSTYDLYPDEAEKYHQDDLEVIRSGKPKLGIIEHYQIASGEKRWVKTDKIPYSDEWGNTIGVIVFAVDITDAKNAQDALEHSLERERLIRSIVEVVSQTFDIDVIIDSAVNKVGRFFNADRCHIIYYNKQGNAVQCQLYGQYCSSPEILPIQEEDIPSQKSILSKKQPGCKTDSCVIFNNATHKPSKEVALFLKRYQVQSVIVIEIIYRSIPFGRLVLHQCTHKHQWTEADIELLENIANQVGAAFYQTLLYHKEQQAKKEAEIANRRKDQFLAHMTHELRTPLNAIIGFAEMLEHGITGGHLTHKQEKYTRNISISGHHLLGMVNDILDIAKIEAGHFKLSIQWVPVQPLLNETENILRELAAQRYVRLQFEVAPNIVGIYADPDRFRQILYNLISNGIKFNRQGGQVTIRVYESEDGQWVCCDVEDTGIGIPPDQMGNLFQEFFQVDNSFTRRHEGTGLGLALTKQLVEHHGGNISVKSQLDKGSVFMFCLPSQPVPQSTSANQP